MSVFKNEKVWRVLTHLWSTIFMVVIIIDFFSKSQYDFLITPMSVIYIGILGLYVGTKEFDRWYEMFEGRHPGELFVIAWTILIFTLLLLPFYLGHEYKVASEAVATYIMVLSVFALTQKSKMLHARKLQHRQHGRRHGK